MLVLLLLLTGISKLKTGILDSPWDLSRAHTRDLLRSETASLRTGLELLRMFYDDLDGLLRNLCNLLLSPISIALNHESTFLMTAAAYG